MGATKFVAKSLCVLFAVAVIGGAATAQTAKTTHARAHRSAQQAVYLIKGLAGFQTGVIDLGERLRQRGITPRIESHLSSDTVADEIIARYRAGMRAPIAIVGYSLGADAAASIARRLYEHKIPVALLVTFAPVADARVTPNVRRAVNYYQSTSAWRGKMVPVQGFRGSMKNVNLDNERDINHFTIISADRLQLATIGMIQSVLGHWRKPAVAGEAAVHGAASVGHRSTAQGSHGEASARSN